MDSTQIEHVVQEGKQDILVLIEPNMCLSAKSVLGPAKVGQDMAVCERGRTKAYRAARPLHPRIRNFLCRRSDRPRTSPHGSPHSAFSAARSTHVRVVNAGADPPRYGSHTHGTAGSSMSMSMRYCPVSWPQ